MPTPTQQSPLPAAVAATATSHLERPGGLQNPDTSARQARAVSAAHQAAFDNTRFTAAWSSVHLSRSASALFSRPVSRWADSIALWADIALPEGQTCVSTSRRQGVRRTLNAEGCTGPICMSRLHHWCGRTGRTHLLDTTPGHTTWCRAEPPCSLDPLPLHRPPRWLRKIPLAHHRRGREPRPQA